jgi:hypothetical protein
MWKIKAALVLGAFALFVSAGWQIGTYELANLELRDDMQDMTSQVGMHVGFNPTATNDQLRDAIVRKAEKYEIPLSPDQVIVEREGYGLDSTLYLAADYHVPVYIFGHTLVLHFTPSSGRKPS